MSKNIGYHTRLYSDNTVKVVGGSFGGQIDQETVDRLTRLFTVVVKPSGTPVFVDRQGREVRLYLSVDPQSTVIGKAALVEHQKQKRIEQSIQEKADFEAQREIDDLMDGLSHDEIIRRLKTVI